MLEISRSRLRAGAAVRGDALTLPFPDGAFAQILTGHFYGHLAEDERGAFLREARRVAGRLVVVDSALRPGVVAAGWQQRVLNDGSRHRVYKRYLRAEELAGEIGGRVLFSGTWFVAAAA
jgi:ubiquinone/menaquinone biosynthesis C-methylase UbiE